MRLGGLDTAGINSTLLVLANKNRELVVRLYRKSIFFNR